MGSIERWAVWIVVLHTVAVSIHAVAHVGVQVLPGIPDGIFIAVVFYAAPVASAVLLRPHPGFARPLYLLTMLLGFVYGSLSHYALPGPDNVASVAADDWGMLFRGTTAALAVLEAVGILFGVLLLQRPRKAPAAAIGA